MCGLVSIFSRSREPIQASMLCEALITLQHRGPDSSSYWIGGSERDVGLGHARLSIIDIEGGQQPLLAGNNALVVNGEFYDYKRIRDDLISRGFHFKTQSDSEILLPLYQEMGLECLSKLRGEFAFSLYDSSSHSLFCARDRFGIKPLFYYSDSNRTIVASEIKAILACGIKPTWNREAASRFVSHFLYHPEETLFSGIRQVPPGHFMIVNQDGVRIHSYWDLNYNSQQLPDSTSERDLTLRFREIFEESVRLRLVADVPIGIYLSGGLDSSAIFGMATHLLTKPPKAFTVKFTDSLYDESQIALETAKFHGTDISFVEVTERDLADNFKLSIWHSETCFTNTHAIAKFLLSRRVRDSGYRVVLTGEGSDEVLGGYSHFLVDFLKQNSVSKADFDDNLQTLWEANVASRGVMISNTHRQIADYQNSVGFTPEFLLPPEGAYDLVDQLYGLNAGRYCEANPHQHVLAAIKLDAIANADFMHRSMYLWTKTVFPNYLLNCLGDRMEMAHSVEARVPFLDHRLVEFLQNIPSHLKYRGQVDKYLLRQAVQDIVTPQVLNRPKHPFLSPSHIDKQNKGPLFDLFQDSLRSEAFARLELFDTEKAVTLMESLHEVPERLHQAVDSVLTTLVSLGLLGEVFQIR